MRAPQVRRRHDRPHSSGTAGGGGGGEDGGGSGGSGGSMGGMGGESGDGGFASGKGVGTPGAHGNWCPVGSSASALAPPTATNRARRQHAHPPPPVLGAVTGRSAGAAFQAVATPLPASLRAAAVSRGPAAHSAPPASCASATSRRRSGVTAGTGSGRRVGVGSPVACVKSCSGSTSLHLIAGRGTHACPSN